MSAEPMKVCKACGVALPIEQFSVRRCEKDGRETNCKPCREKKQKAWREANKEHIKATRKKWRDANRDHLKACKKKNYMDSIDSYRAKIRKWHHENPEKVHAVFQKWREANREHLSMSKKAWYQADPEKTKARVKAWRKANPEKVKAYEKKGSDNLVDWYLKIILVSQTGLAAADMPPALVELKREQLQIRRMARELKNSIKQLKEEVTP